jgi:hypothetical protein
LPFGQKKTTDLLAGNTPGEFSLVFVYNRYATAGQKKALRGKK